ncbi:MAG TPA: M3 family metallopeptidase [Acidiferrobacteraceae bacterium]|nr:M3 family metallopeptidase [Acidiferrobacteraceae bacterium]
MSDENVLLDLQGLPRFRAITPELIEPAVASVLSAARARREAVFAAGGTPRWERSIAPLEDAGEHISRVWSPVSHLHAVADTPALREAYTRCLPSLSAYGSEVAQDERVYRTYLEVAQNEDGLTPAQQRLIENALRDFRMGGAELPPEAKDRLRAIQQELSTLTSRFEQNVLDATRGWTLTVTDEQALAGLPESVRALARDNAQQAGIEGWQFTLDAPSYVPFMTYAERRDLRAQMYEAYVTRASAVGPQAGQWNNDDAIGQILSLRQESARLLGFANYAEKSLASKMARNPGRVFGFLRDLAQRARPAAVREFQELAEFARAEGGPGALAAWDVAYYSNRLRERRYAFSEEDVRPYFPLPQVLSGMFEVVRRLYGLAITERAGVDTWHPDVRFYDIRDEQGVLRGGFYTDLYAREGKRGGAWMDECISRKRTATGIQTPVAYLTCNFGRPVGGKPSLLSHDEVTTLFHEFGHGLHHMLTLVDYAAVSGINGVEWDAVELPSQFMENWCWEREALEFIGGHYQTHAPLPDALFERMHAARNFQSALQMMRQLEFALFDMRIHADYAGGGAAAVQQILDEVRREVTVVPVASFNRFQNSFTHIFSGGYAAGYYSYKWAEVLSADAFSRFEERGVFDRDTGRAFLHHILEQGGAHDPLELFVAFRGREPTIDALLRHSGLAA